jgi:hypothetical protein
MNITLVKSCLIKPKQEPQEVFLKVVIWWVLGFRVLPL